MAARIFVIVSDSPVVVGIANLVLDLPIKVAQYLQYLKIVVDFDITDFVVVQVLDFKNSDLKFDY